jgi:hypothetical protein
MMPKTSPEQHNKTGIEARNNAMMPATSPEPRGQTGVRQRMCEKKPKTPSTVDQMASLDDFGFGPFGLFSVSLTAFRLHKISHRTILTIAVGNYRLFTH